MTVIQIVIGALSRVTTGLIQELEDLEIRGRVEINQNYSIIKISQNTEKTAGDLGRLVVTQTSVVWKTRKGVAW